MPKRARAAYFRAYRLKNADGLRAYWRERARRAYVKKPRLRLRAPRKPTAAALDAVRVLRLAIAETALAAERATSLAYADANPELAALIREQARDSRRYWIKFDAEPEECWRAA